MIFYKLIELRSNTGIGEYYFATVAHGHAWIKAQHPNRRTDFALVTVDVATDKAGILNLLNGKPDTFTEGEFSYTFTRGGGIEKVYTSTL